MKQDKSKEDALLKKMLEAAKIVDRNNEMFETDKYIYFGTMEQYRVFLLELDLLDDWDYLNDDEILEEEDEPV